MTARQACSRAPGPLEDFVASLKVFFGLPGQRRSFRAYLTELLVPRDRNKTLTALAGTEPLTQALAAWLDAVNSGIPLNLYLPA